MPKAHRSEALASFAAELASLRTACGDPSYARLYRASSLLPPATISDVLRGRSVPRIEFVMAFVQACLDHADAQAIPVDPVARSLDAWRSRWRAMKEKAEHSGVGEVGAGAAGGRGRAPWQLPPAPRWLVGREADLEWLDGEGFGPGCRFTVLHGPSGVGKTSLAVLWAYHRRDRFPDGVLFYDLRAFGPEPTKPSEDILRYFLTALGRDGASLTGTASELLGVFRTVVADRRMLIILDNARDAEQVRELLAIGENSCVLVTSQERMPGLSIRDGAAHHEVVALSEDAAVALINRPGHQLGSERARRVARACGYLPLALRIVAEKLEQDPSSESVDRFLAEVEADPGVLVRTDSGDPRSNLDTLFAWALDARSAPERRALLLLSDFPGAVIDPHEATAVIGTRHQTAQRIVAALIGQHLVQPRGSGRFQLHPLLRAWASARALSEITEEERRSARLRLLGYYLWTADAADRVVLPQRNRPALDSDLPKPLAAPPIGVRESALQWTDEHVANFILAASWPEARTFAMVMPHVLMSYLDLRKPWARWLELTEVGLAVAQDQPDHRLWANLLNSRGIVLRETGRVDEAIATFEAAAESYGVIGDRQGQSMALNNVGTALTGQGRPAEAVVALTSAMEVLEWSHDWFRRAIVRHNLAEAYIALGEYAEAIPFATEAVQIAEEIDDLDGAALSLVALARAHHLSGETDEALEEYARALVILEETGDVFGQATAHRRLGETFEELGRAAMASAHRERSEALMRQLNESA